MITPSFVFHSIFLLLCLAGGVWAFAIHKRYESLRHEILPLLLGTCTKSSWHRGLLALEIFLSDHLRCKVYIENPGLPADKTAQTALLTPFFELLSLPAAHAQSRVPPRKILRWRYAENKWNLL